MPLDSHPPNHFIVSCLSTDLRKGVSSICETNSFYVQNDPVIYRDSSRARASLRLRFLLEAIQKRKLGLGTRLDSCWLHAAENECPCIVCELPMSMAGEGEWYNSQHSCS